MKKLFFLCAFLFMSMQIQAQMYIVIVKHDVSGLVKTVISPDGSTSREAIPTGFGKPSFNYADSDYLIPAMQNISSTLNEIIKKGYTLLEMPLPYLPDGELINVVYYLTK